MENLEKLILHCKELKPEELHLVTEAVMSALQSYEYDEDRQDPTGEYCKKCGGKNCFSKYGKDRNGKQRYRCKRCTTTFTDTSFSVVYNTHRPLSTWEKYVECMLQDLSLHKCARLCQISVQTAFLWKHKISSMLRQEKNKRFFSGIIEF